MLIFDVVSKLELQNTDTITPAPLVAEMLDRLPADTWSDPTRTFIDLAGGTGTFIVSIILRLNEGLRSVMPDAGIRLRHIMTHQVHYNDISPQQVRRYRAALRRLGIEQWAQNTYNFDALAKEWHMKFDVVVGNPPYQDSSSNAKNQKLWPKFVQLSYDLLKDENSKVCLVTPSSWMTNSSNQGQRQRNLITSKNLIYAKNTDGVWDIGVNTAFFFAENKKYESRTLLEGYEFDSWDFNNVMLTNEEQENILNKILNYPKRLNLRSLPSPDRKSCSKSKSEVYQYEIHFSGPKVEYSSMLPNQDKIKKYVFPFSCSYKNHFWTDKPIGMLNLYIECDEQDKHKYESYMDLEAVRFLCENYNKTAGFTPAIKNSLLPDFLGMTDSDVYNVLCITKEEQQIIKASIK